jgi:hypothetical protein
MKQNIYMGSLMSYETEQTCEQQMHYEYHLDQVKCLSSVWNVCEFTELYISVTCSIAQMLSFYEC